MDKAAAGGDNLSMSRALRTIVKDEVQQILDHFCYSFGIRILFYTPEGEILRVGLNRPDSGFCRLIRETYGEERCLNLDDAMRRQAASERRMIRYRCHAGLNETIEPIFVHGTLVGYAMIGQFRSREGVRPEALADFARKFGDDAPIRAALAELPLVDEAAQDHVIGLFRVLVEYIVSKELIAVQAGMLMGRIRDYVEEHLPHPVRLGDVAQALGKSPSTISHTVKEHTGRSFKRFSMEARVAYAEQIMQRRPGLGVAEVAALAGYEDQFYFSRVYRKIRGVPPSRFSSRNGAVP